MEKRIRRMGIFLLLCFLALFIQLNNIQIFKANALANDPSNPNVIAAQENLSRGNILSANGVILASSVPSVGTFSKYQRVYDPATVSLFSQIVGYDSPIYGMTGIESEYNSYLQSHTTPATTLRQLLVSRTGTDNVTLTISTTLQQDVANALNTANARGTAPEAGAVVLNVKTGAIEAMYGNPTYDPTPLVSSKGSVERAAWNSLITAYASNPENSPVLSRAFQRTFLPGSTFKVVTSSAVFDHQPALARKDYPVVSCIPLPQSGGLQLCNYAGANGVHESCGGTIEQTLPSSCNTAFAQMGEALGGVVMNTEAQGFGFNHRIPLDLPYVPASTFPSIADLTNNTPLSEYSAFGQATSLAGDSASALQMALVAEGIANNGVIMTPHVMNRIVDDQGNLVESFMPKAWLTATSPQTAAAVTQLMQAVVTRGTATGVGFPAAWDVAAKTGTAETGSGTAQGNNLTNDWMVAFAPASNPRVAVAVVIPNQAGSSTGAEISGPPMKTILGEALAATPQ